MYSIKKISFFNVLCLARITTILYRCGKDMYKKNGLTHWNNSIIKCVAIVLISVLNNRVYLVYDADKNAVATFQTKQNNEIMRFCKLATDPLYAGKGVGSFCISAIESLARTSGCKKVRCEVYEKSKHAIEFYKHRGYSESGEEKTLKYTEIKMEKVL